MFSFSKWFGKSIANYSRSSCRHKQAQSPAAAHGRKITVLAGDQENANNARQTDDANQLISAGGGEGSKNRLQCALPSTATRLQRTKPTVGHTGVILTHGDGYNSRVAEAAEPSGSQRSDQWWRITSRRRHRQTRGTTIGKLLLKKSREAVV